MTYEECLELVMAFGNIAMVDGEQSQAGQRDQRIASAVETMADFIASMMASNGGRIRHDCEPV